MKVIYFSLIYLLYKACFIQSCIRARHRDNGGNGNNGGNGHNTPTPPVATTTTLSTTTKAPVCGNVRGRARLYLDPSATASGVTNPFFGSKDGIECPLCSNTRYYSSATSDVFDGSANSGAINTFQCPVDQKLCLCDKNFNCFEENDPTVSTTLYPYCTSPTSCYVYSIISAETNSDGVFPAGGGKGWTPANTTTPNFTFKSVRTGVFEKVSAISCNGCPISLSEDTCLPEQTTF